MAGMWCSISMTHVVTSSIAMNGCEAGVAASLPILVLITCSVHGVADPVHIHSLLASRCLPTLAEAVTLAGLGTVCNAGQ